MGKSIQVSSYKARLIKDQNGRCGICRELSLPDDRIERDHIIPKHLGGKNILKNVQTVHRYCYFSKTKVKIGNLNRKNKI